MDVIGCPGALPDGQPCLSERVLLPWFSCLCTITLGKALGPAMRRCPWSRAPTLPCDAVPRWTFIPGANPVTRRSFHVLRGLA